MKKYKLTIILVFLSLLTGMLYCLSPHFPSWIERYYSHGINAYFIRYLSQLTGLLPFSLAELGCLLLILYFFIHTLYHLFHSIHHPKSARKHLTTWCIHSTNLLCILWLSFALGWGFNYSRLPLMTTLNLSLSDIPHEDLGSLYTYLIEHANTLRTQVTEDSDGYMSIEGGFDSVKTRALVGFDALSEKHALFIRSTALPKALAISPLMNYTGITGIYSPFTAEANVNTSILDQSLPTTTLHEMAHLRGFASEAECNFLAFLGCSMHPDVDFQYSGYLLAIAYTSQTLARVNYDLLLQLNGTISEAVMNDIAHNNRFWKQYEGPVEQASTSINNTYLKVNGVETGVANYGEMVTLLLGYYTTYLQS